MLLLLLGLVTGLLEQRFTRCSKTTENQYRHSDNCDRHGEKSDCDNALLPWLTAEVTDSGRTRFMTLLTAHHSRRNPRARLLDSKRWLDSPFDAQGRQCHSTRSGEPVLRIVHCQTPERSPNCLPEQRHAGRPRGRAATNTYTANKEVICQSEATPSNRTQYLRL